MSNYLAVGTVSAALGQRVLASVESAVSGVSLRFDRPAPQSTGVLERRVHVYLYQVSPDAALRNADLPARNSDGRLQQRPRAALELHYLVSFYGDDQLLEPNRMMAAVARDLHAQPLLAPHDIANALKAYKFLAASDLADAEHVRFTPATLSLDEQTKLWSVMLQTPHALSLVYLASAVVLDARELPSPVLPVLKRGEQDRGAQVSVGAFPTLETLWAGFTEAADRHPRMQGMRAAQLGARIVIDGDALAGDSVTLQFSHPALPLREIEIAAPERSGSQLRTTLPDDAAAQTQWAAGLYRVAARIRRGDIVRQSSALPMILSPRIVSIEPSPATRQNGKVSLKLTCRPNLLAQQAAVLLLAGREIVAQTRQQLGNTVIFEVDQAPVLDAQLVWLRVDGAESQPVLFDTAAGSLVFDDAQRVTIK